MPEAANDALAKIDQAFQRFSRTVSPQDVCEFNNTKLKDVWEAARAVQKAMADKGHARGLKRIEPLLERLEHYSPLVEFVCGSTHYLSWIWAPIKLFVQLASTYLSAYDKLINAYEEIANALPRFDTLSKTFKERPDFQAVLAGFYCDILDFHRRAYRFFRATAWKRFFDSAWGRFDRHFAGIIESLKNHADLIDRSANAYEIAAAQQMREILLESVRKWEKERAENEFVQVINWLNIKDFIQEDDVHRLDSECHKGTADWFLQHAKVTKWIEVGHHRSLWVNGTPGCGKSVLCSQLIRHMQQQKQGALAYFICDFRSPGRNTCSIVLRLMTSQLIKQNQGLVDFVYDECVLKGLTPAKTVLTALLQDLLSGITSPRLLVDGLDECKASDQEEILKEIRTIVSEASKKSDCKPGFAIFSTDTAALEKNLKDVPTISLKKEATHVGMSIRAVVRHKMQQIWDELRDELLDGSFMEEVLMRIEQKVVAKADGMFLWVRLMLGTLSNLNSATALEKAVETLPRGIKKAYERLLEDLASDDPQGSLRRATALFSLIALADRPLKTYEAVDGIVLCEHPYQLNESTKLTPRELDRCKPLIEIDTSGNVSFVHFTVKEYILDQSSGPFLRHEQALCDVAMACVSYMVSSLDLVDPSMEDNHPVKSIALGLHGLHRYARSKWLWHVEELCKVYRVPADLPPDPPLVEYIKALCKRHDQLLRLKRPQNSIIHIDTDDDKRLTAFRDVQEFRPLAGRIREHERQNGGVAHDQSQDENDATKDDPTLFTEVSDTYDAILQQLLMPESERRFAYLSKQCIARFKKMYGVGAYPCRAIACSRHEVGFSTKLERIMHEVRSHPDAFYCSESSCAFSKPPGFPTRSALQAHALDMHLPEDPSDLGPSRKQDSKRRHLKDACGLGPEDAEDAEVDEIARKTLKKNYGSEDATDHMADHMAAREPVLHSHDNMTQEQPPAERRALSGPSHVAAHGQDESIADAPVDRDGAVERQTAKMAEPGPQSNIAATSSSATDEKEISILLTAIRLLSQGPMKIEDIIKEMGLPPEELFLLPGFLYQIAERREEEYHLKSGVADELQKMMVLPR